MTMKPDLKGVYSLLIVLESEALIRIGKLGRVSFPAGFYVYVGSALGKGPTGLMGRIIRHLSDKKKNFWHIDYFLSSSASRVVGVVFAETSENKEHDVVRELKSDAEIVCKRFGASDCRRECESHLLYLGRGSPGILKLVEDAYKRLRLEPITLLLEHGAILD